MRKVASSDNDSQPFPWILVLLNPKLRDLGKEYPLYGWLRARQRSQSSLWKPIAGIFFAFIYFLAAIMLTSILLYLSENGYSKVFLYTSYSIIPVSILGAILVCWWLTRPRQKCYFPSTINDLVHHLKSKSPDLTIASSPIDPVHLYEILFFERIRSKMNTSLGLRILAVIFLIGPLLTTSMPTSFTLICFATFPLTLLAIWFWLSRCMTSYNLATRQDSLRLEESLKNKGIVQTSMGRWRKWRLILGKIVFFWMALVMNIMLVEKETYGIFFFHLSYNFLVFLFVYYEFRDKGADQKVSESVREELRQDFADLIARNQEPVR